MLPHPASIEAPISSVKAAVQAGAGDALQRDGKGSSAQGQAILGGQLPDALEGLSHYCRADGAGKEGSGRGRLGGQQRSRRSLAAHRTQSQCPHPTLPCRPHSKPARLPASSHASVTL